MLIAYRNRVDEGDVVDYEGGAGYLSTMPLTNLQDRRLAIKARAADGEGSPSIGVSWDDPGVTIGFVALLATNVINSCRVRLYTFSGTVFDQTFNVMNSDLLLSDLFPRHVLCPLGQHFDDVLGLEVTPHTSTSDFEAGRLWAGPYWEPTGKTARRDFRMQTRDDSVAHKSIGQQVYVDYRPRYRQLTCTIPVLTEEEAIGTEDGETQNLQDTGFAVGRGGEVIIVPLQESPQLIHRLGVYGRFLEPPEIRLIEDATGRHYTSTFDVVEDL